MFNDEDQEGRGSNYLSIKEKSRKDTEAERIEFLKIKKKQIQGRQILVHVMTKP